nr:37s ribosomal protein s22, mitochondrial [Quercus suber]
MFTPTAPTCYSCRLRAQIAAKTLARTRCSAPSRSISTNRAKSVGCRNSTIVIRRSGKPGALLVKAQYDRRLASATRAFSATTAPAFPRTRRRDDLRSFSEEWGAVDEDDLMADGTRLRGKSVRRKKVEEDQQVYDELLQTAKSHMTAEERARLARETFGNALPEYALNEEEMKAYQRLYGKPVLDNQDEMDSALNTEEGAERIWLREGKDGSLEEVELEDDGSEYKEMDNTAADFMEEDSRNPQQRYKDDGIDDEQDDDPSMRTHPWTQINRFATNPTSVILPRDSFVEPATASLNGMSTTHLEQAALRIFGGPGLPYSTSTPNRLKTMQQKPIALDAYQSSMSEMEGHVYVSALMPAIYASVMSTLTETRKRLGTKWAEEMVRKANAGELRILDAGGAGAGIIAVREMLRAEWERMHQESADLPDSVMALAEADGKIGGASASPPLGHATVLTASDVLRRRAGQLLENTTFLPRLPDYLHSEVAREKGKFDIIVAPHSLLSIEKDYMRKRHVQNLWNLLTAQGGVLIILEKGVARGFEAVAAAREMLLDTTIASPGSEHKSTGIFDPAIVWDGEESAHAGPEPLTKPKEKGMIIAPCTNHDTCPMYHDKGIVKGRKDVCRFEQRYVRPTLMQRILQGGAKAKNFEDVEFSYLSVMRGRDVRSFDSDLRPIGHDQNAPVVQGEEATDRAFDDPYSYADIPRSAVPDSSLAPPSLTLPRMILPPMKRKGHIILDLCTSAGTLERWTVPRSFGQQAFRDARKSSWGDLWALGAKTRNVRSLRQPKHGPDGKYASTARAERGDDKKAKTQERRQQKDEMAAQREEAKRLKNERRTERKEAVAAQIKEERALERERLKKLKEEKRDARPSEKGEGGRMRVELVKGIRDKRDKKGGFGRREEEDD